MNHYEPPIPRAALGIAAAALTALSIGLAVVVPAMMEPTGQGPGTWAASTPISPAPIQVVIIPAHIDVVVGPEPEQELVSAQVRHVDPKCKQQQI